MIKHLWNKWIIDWRSGSFRAHWHNIWTFPKNFYQFIKEVCFFLKYGYPYEATYEHFKWFYGIERSILECYLKTHSGFPGVEGAATNEEWEAVIRRMIELLDGMDEDKYPKRDRNMSTATYYIEQNNFLENNKKEFFELYSKWFYNLWD